MLGLCILANGFEPAEAVVTVDILRRAGIRVVTASVTGNRKVESAYGIEFTTDLAFDQICDGDYDFLFIPGGAAVTKILDKTPTVSSLIRRFASENELIATICAAPMLVGKLGLFENEQFTCFPSCEQGIKGTYVDQPVVVSDNFITGKAMFYTVDFALAIVEYLLGRKARLKVARSIKGQA